MRRLGLAAVLLAVLTAVEIAVLVLVAGAIGYGWTVLLLLATSLLGAALLRREGSRAWRRFQAAVQSGRPSGGEASRGLLGLAAGLLLVVPGFVTDLAGLILVTPPVRAAGVRLLERAAQRRMSPAAAGDLFGPRRVRVKRADEPPSTVVEGEVVDGP